jgi:hypothetical protein
MKRGFGKSIQLLSIFLAHATLFAQSTPVTTDSIWVEDGDFSKWFGIAAAVPCAILGGIAGHGLATDPDGGGPPQPVRGTLIGAAVGAVICGLPASVIGTFFHRRKLVYSARPLSRADTLEILEQVSSKAWNMIRPGDSVQLLPFDELTRDALRATLLANKATTHPVWLRGESTACPIAKMPDQHGPLAYVVGMHVSELNGETIAYLALGCGHGFAPGTAYSAKWSLKMRREKNRWIVGEPSLVYIT